MADEFTNWPETGYRRDAAALQELMDGAGGGGDVTAAGANVFTGTKNTFRGTGEVVRIDDPGGTGFQYMTIEDDTTGVTSQTGSYFGAGWIEIWPETAADTQPAIAIGDWTDSYRFKVMADGSMQWSGAAGPSWDTNLYRLAPNVLRTDDELQVQNLYAVAPWNSVGLGTIIPGEAWPRFWTKTQGTMEWSDGTAAPDTNLYRSGTTALATDSTLNVGVGTVNQVVRVGGTQAGIMLQNVVDADTSYARGGLFHNAIWDTTTNLWNVKNIGANDAGAVLFGNGSYIDFIVHGSVATADRTFTHANFIAARQMRINAGAIDAYAPIAMNSQKITGLAAGTNPSDAVRFDQLGAGGGGDMTKATYDPNNDGVIAIAQGGTGATSAASALSALGAAALASPTFTGTPAAPTAGAGTNTTQLATTAFVTAAVAAGGGGSGTPPGWADLRDHGGVGNGTADDTAAWQAAVTAAGTNGTIFVPEGIWTILGTGSGAVDLLDGQTVLGLGRGSRIRALAATGTTKLFRVGTANYQVRFVNLRAEGAASFAAVADRQYCVQLGNVNGAEVEAFQCEFARFGPAISTFNDTTGQKITLVDCIIDGENIGNGSGGQKQVTGIAVQSSCTLVARNTEFINNGSDNTGGAPAGATSATASMPSTQHHLTFTGAGSSINMLAGHPELRRPCLSDDSEVLEDPRLLLRPFCFQRLLLRADQSTVPIGH